MSINYPAAVENLKQSQPDIVSVAIIEERDKIVYSTQDWNLSEDIAKIVSIWDSQYGQAISVSGKKYSVLQSTIERLVATSIQEGHIVGAKDDERKILARVRPDGNMLTAYMATARALKIFSSRKPYMAPEVQLGKSTIPSYWDTPKLREELMKGLIDFFKQGGKLEKPDETYIERREKERKKRMEELEKVLSALEITEEDYVNIIIETEFKTDYIYDDFQLLKAKHEIEKLIKKQFQIHEPFKVKITKKL